MAKQGKLEFPRDNQAQRIDELNDTMVKLDENIPPSTNRTYQVYSSSSEQTRDERELDYRPVDTRNENRDSLLRKVEMPMSSGYNPYGWIARAERYFRVTRYDPEARMDLDSLSLEEDALSWYNYEVEHRPFVDCSEFKRRMLARSAESYEKTLGKRLFGFSKQARLQNMLRNFKT